MPIEATTLAPTAGRRRARHDLLRRGTRGLPGRVRRGDRVGSWSRASRGVDSARIHADARGGGVDGDALVVTAIDASGRPLSLNTSPLHHIRRSRTRPARRTSTCGSCGPDYAPSKVKLRAARVASATVASDARGRRAGSAGSPASRSRFAAAAATAARPGIVTKVTGVLRDRRRVIDSVLQRDDDQHRHRWRGGQELPLPGARGRALPRRRVWYARAPRRQRRGAARRSRCALRHRLVIARRALDMEPRAAGRRDGREILRQGLACAAPRRGRRAALRVHRKGAREAAGHAGPGDRRRRRRLLSRPGRVSSLSAQRLFDAPQRDARRARCGPATTPSSSAAWRAVRPRAAEIALDGGGPVSAELARRRRRAAFQIR